jgi:hypothetical protein
VLLTYALIALVIGVWAGWDEYVHRHHSLGAAVGTGLLLTAVAFAAGLSKELMWRSRGR